MIANISPISTKLPFGKSQLFSYFVPDDFQNEIKPGMIVEIPLGTRVVQGVVYEIDVETRLIASLREKNLKLIIRIIPDIQLNQIQLNLAMWMHKFYHAPLGIVLKFIIPDVPKKEIKRLRDKEIREIEEIRDNQFPNFPISQFLGNQNERFKKYIELIKKYKKQSASRRKQVLILVPNIIDIETLYIRLGVIFDEGGRGAPLPLRIGKLHSQLNMTEYYRNWFGSQSGEIDVMIGTRQAILSPPSNLGLVIIDEYQDDDFKQLDQTPRFSAVEVAKKISEMTGVKLVLGASSPPIEIRDFSYPQSKKTNKNIAIIDSQNEYYGKNFSPLSNKLQELLLKNKAWSFIMVNRRGEAAFAVCKDCGNVMKCPKCDIPLVLHKTGKNEILMCHSCLHKTAPPEKCSICKGHKIKYSLPGTQGVEREIKKIVGDNANVIRIDGDALKTKKETNDILKKIQKNRGIIIGTQVAVKLWMPKEFELIGFLYADNFLNRADFKASEKTFQIIQELKSRLSPRSNMIIQTFNPENEILSQSAAGDFDSFCKNELSIRKQFHYPPFVRIIKLSLAGKDIRKILRETDYMKKIILPRFKNIEILGPTPMENAKRGLFGKTLILKISDWNENMHLDLMENIPDEWTVEIS